MGPPPEGFVVAQGTLDLGFDTMASAFPCCWQFHVIGERNRKLMATGTEKACRLAGDDIIAVTSRLVAKDSMLLWTTGYWTRHT